MSLDAVFQLIGDNVWAVCAVLLLMIAASFFFTRHEFAAHEKRLDKLEELAGDCATRKDLEASQTQVMKALEIGPY